MEKAVIMARGLGSRMRKADDSATLSEEQRLAAETGVKAMIPVGRPFLDYVLHTLAEAGYNQVCLVIGPEHTKIRDYYAETVKPERIKVDFAVQEKPLGTSDAVAAAESFAGDDPFLVINSDNYYPLEALKRLREIDGPGLAAFDKDAMLAESNIPADRISRFSVTIVEEGYMKEIVEKPSPEFLDSLKGPVGISMNCWRFDQRIFEACRNIQPSPRGEWELTDSVNYTIERLGAKYRALAIAAPVLDITCRADIEAVAAKLKGAEVRL